MAEKSIVISRQILNDGKLWEEIQSRSTPVPRDIADECDRDVMDAMKTGNDKMRAALRESAARVGQAIIE